MACKVYNDFKFKTLLSSEGIRIVFNNSLKAVHSVERSGANNASCEHCELIRNSDPFDT